MAVAYETKPKDQWPEAGGKESSTDGQPTRAHDTY